MSTTLEEKKKTLDFVVNFSEIAKKKKWISHYDTDSDSLVIRTPKLSEDSRKKYINNEFAFYLNRKSDIEGVFIEYFISNFVSHHKKEFKPILNDLKKDLKNKKGSSMIELKKNEVKKLASGLESFIINSITLNGQGTQGIGC